MTTSPVATCPHCAKKFRGKGDMTGKKIRCPFCQEPFVVGAETPVAAAVGKAKAPVPAAKTASPPAPAPAPASTPPMEEAFGIGDQGIENRCPNCAEPMPNEKATICLFCGYNMLTREWGKTSVTEAVDFKQHLLHLAPGLFCLVDVLSIVGFLIWYCTTLAQTVAGGEWDFLSYEPTKMWTTMILLAVSFPMATFAFQRLVVNPRPEEVKKSK